MSVIVEFIVPAADFQLGRLIEGDPGAQFELDRMIPTTEAIVPFFWARGTDFDALEDRLAADEAVRDVALLDRVDDQALFRVEWPPDINGLVQSIIAREGVIASAVGTSDRWEFQLRFPNQEAVSGFQADCRAADVNLDLKRLYDPIDPGMESDTTGLTPAQRETVVTALEAGYFEIPRETNLVEIAEELGIADQSVNERLRRAQTKLFTRLLITNAESDSDSDSGPESE